MDNNMNDMNNMNNMNNVNNNVNNNAGGVNNPFGQTYQNPNGANPYVAAPKPPKKKGGWGVFLGKCVVAALIVGLLGGTIFGTVNWGINKITNKGTVSETTQTSSKNTITAEDVKQDKTKDETPIASTNTSATATDLTDVSSIVNEVIPCIVAITNVGTTSVQSYWGTQEYESTSCGSGIIIAQDDDYIYIATNNHVVEGAKTLTVQFSDNSTVDAQIKGTEASDDLAVVMVKRTDIQADTLKTIKVATVAEAQPAVGNAAIAIGNALGYGQSVTTGVISALGRSVNVQDETTGATVIHNNLIQTDAAINPGNSGGALLNANGEVIGINSVKYTETSVEGIGYAIPINDAMVVIERIITREKVDEADAAYLGIQGIDVNSQMSSTYGWPVGVYVYEAVSGGAAEKAGIKAKDVIVGIDGQTISSMSELKNELSYYKAGEKIKVSVQRLEGDSFKSYDIDVTLDSAKDK